ncbi:hypothetical protein [Demequina sp. NBRC 110057]|uniref:hypothetical protein n=1 Tax=Demequina sp. NBRC 110057 TaxID=1570346 RepID=UPI0009FD5145|nr:hypothetical protein [Demequina sp. NBRC 110057]
MLLVHSADVSPVAFRRMLADGALAPLLPGVARPVDVPESSGVRAAAAACHTHPGLTLTGLGALWVAFGGRAPTSLDLAARDHRHARSWAPTMPSRVHSGVGVGTRSGAVAAPPEALVDALRWADLGLALPRASRLLAAGLVDAAATLKVLDDLSTRDHTWRRAWSAWGALRAAQGPMPRVRPAVAYSGRLAPVMRRAS